MVGVGSLRVSRCIIVGCVAAGICDEADHSCRYNVLAGLCSVTCFVILVRDGSTPIMH